MRESASLVVPSSRSDCCVIFFHGSLLPCMIHTGLKHV